MEPWAEAIAHWMATQRGGLTLRLLCEWLVAEHGYGGSYKAVQRFVRARYPKPKLRARRRVETPPGAQAQADWAGFPQMAVGRDGVRDLYAFHLVLSHSRREAIVWSERMDELAWLHLHNEALRRLGGVPAVIRVDNCKTAIATGAGPWGTVNERYAAYARALRFHVDATRPRAPEEKGKVERRILAHQRGFDPRRRAWDAVAELQARTDTVVDHTARQRICPATGVLRALLDEARDSGRSVTLHVEPANPACQLYERLGFRAWRDAERAGPAGGVGPVVADRGERNRRRVTKPEKARDKRTPHEAG